MIDAARFKHRSLTAALVAAVLFSGSAFSQGRLSLAERVEQLERQAQGGQDGGTMAELTVRNQELQAEVQSLRGLVENQAFEIQSLQKQLNNKFLDLDSRLQRLEGGGMTVPAPPAPPTMPLETPAPSQLGNDEPVLSAPENQVTRIPPVGAETVGGAVAAPSMASADEKLAYETAFEALKQGRYAESSELFAAFLQQYPSGEFAGNATYWLGESYYVTQNYDIALKTFQDLLGRFPDSRKSPDALLKVGYCQYELGDPTRAARTLNEVIERYPDTPVARLAQGRLRALRLDGQ
jgi:tol-pal system protein YbgF